MRIIRKTAIAAASLMVAGVGFVGAAPSHASTGDTCVIVAQAANVSSAESPNGGLYYPVTDPNIGNHPIDGPSFQWNLSGTCANNGNSFTSFGTAQGWCGRSVGHGTGSVNGNSYTVYWESVGSELTLLDQSATGNVNAQPPPPPAGGNCTDGSATQFLVSGSITDLR